MRNWCDAGSASACQSSVSEGAPVTTSPGPTTTTTRAPGVPIPHRRRPRPRRRDARVDLLPSIGELLRASHTVIVGVQALGLGRRRVVAFHELLHAVHALPHFGHARLRIVAPRVDPSASLARRLQSYSCIPRVLGLASFFVSCRL